MAKGYVETHPWGGHMPQGTRSERDKEPERPFTDAEVMKLLTGTTDAVLLDMMKIAALERDAAGGDSLADGARCGPERARSPRQGRP